MTVDLESRTAWRESMRRWWSLFGLLIAILGAVGCPDRNRLRPPKGPEEYRDPPAEKRFLEPPQPPPNKSEDDLQRPQPGDQGPPKPLGSPSRAGVGGRPGM